jgi:light-harvesting complex 1 beta chain
MADDKRSGTGLTADEAKAFHRAFMNSTLAFIAVSLIAHILIWNWRPWF